ncbi:MAG: sugar ABC transporter permease [Firmicutes bacterium]|nr:sugar ABC transporter permease [Bacillota bacterium]
MLLSPAILWILLIVIYPFVSAIRLSFMKTAFGFGLMRPNGLENYRLVLGDEAFWRALLTSFWWTLGNLILQLTLPMFVALLLRRKFAGRDALRSIILTPWIIPAVVIAILWRWLLEPTVGILNSILHSLHIVDKPVSFLGRPDLALVSIILVNTWRFAPLGTVLILAALQTIPEVLYEAARVDGASPVQEFLRITFPLLGNVVWFVGLLASIWTFNILDLIWLMTQGGPGTSTQTMPVLIYQTAFKTYQMGIASAMAVMTAMGLIVLAFVYFRFMKPRESGE